MANKLALRDPWPLAGFGSLFNDFQRDFFNDRWYLPTAALPEAKCQRIEDRLVLELDVPGVKKEDIKVALQEGRLSVSWSKKGETHSHTEFVGDIVEPHARVEDGVLTVSMRIPQAEKIEVPVE
jgi:HSP20 family molecular chaperone IbpA